MEILFQAQWPARGINAFLNVRDVNVIAAAPSVNSLKIHTKSPRRNGRYYKMSASANDYAQMFGNIHPENNVSMAKCACVACNSCTCACSCARCKKYTPDKEELEW